MKKKYLIKKLIIILSILFITSCTDKIEKKSYGYISLTPSISEIFIYLGAENQLVGKTEYCNYPSIDSVAIIGTIMAPSIEKISKLNPKSIIILKSQKKYLKLPDNLKINTVMQNSISTIFGSVNTISSLLKIKSNKVKNDLKKIDKIKSKFKNRKSKSFIALVSTNKINNNNISFYIASETTYYNDILSIFNFKNLAIDSTPSYQKQSMEYLEKLKPEYIFNFSNIDISDDIKKTLSYTPQIITVSEKFASIPGPISVMKLIERLETDLR